MNVYMPFDDSKVEFLNTLSVIENILVANASCQVVFGGDFAVECFHSSCNSSVLKDFSVRMKLYPLIDHSQVIDYSYHFAMRHFHTLDYFIVSEQIFQEPVNKMFVIHDVDNLCDHESICLHLKCDISRFNVRDRRFVSDIAWHKAKQDDLLAYSTCLREALMSLYNAEMFTVKYKSHLSALKYYMDAISNAVFMLLISVSHIQHRGPTRVRCHPRTRLLNLLDRNNFFGTTFGLIVVGLKLGMLLM